MKELFSKFKRILSSISKNIYWIILSNVIIAICQFITLAIINQKLGKEILGVWSLVVAATSIGQLSGFGLSSGLIRYLPEFFIKNDSKGAEKMVSTVNMANLFFSLPIIILLYFPIMMYAHHLLKGIQLDIFNSVIIWSLVTLFITNIFSVYSFLFDALQKFYIRSIIQIAGWLLFLVLTIVLIPSMQLKGIAIANVVQAIFQVIVARIIVHRMKIFDKKILFNFDKATFYKIFSFGTQFQLINILVIFFDPLVKFFITRGVGLNATANYELANKISMQARNLLVNANQVIIPKAVTHKTQNTLQQYFSLIIKKNLLFSTMMGMIVLVLSPIAILIFAGHFDKTLLSCIIIINIGWVCNMITSIHYFTSIAADKLIKLIVMHLLYSVVSIAGFYILLKSGINILTAMMIPAISLVIGSIYNSIALRHLKTSLKWLYSTEFISFILISIILLFVPFSSFMQSILILLLCFFAFLILLIPKLKVQLNNAIS